MTPPTNSARVNCQPSSTSRMIPSSMTRLVEANWNAMAAGSRRLCGTTNGPAPPPRSCTTTTPRPSQPRPPGSWAGGRRADGRWWPCEPVPRPLQTSRNPTPVPIRSPSPCWPPSPRRGRPPVPPAPFSSPRSSSRSLTSKLASPVGRWDDPTRVLVRPNSWPHSPRAHRPESRSETISSSARSGSRSSVPRRGTTLPNVLPRPQWADTGAAAPMTGRLGALQPGR